jgi:hypothetical protein
MFIHVRFQDDQCISLDLALRNFSGNKQATMRRCECKLSPSICLTWTGCRKIQYIFWYHRVRPQNRPSSAGLRDLMQGCPFTVYRRQRYETYSRCCGSSGSTVSDYGLDNPAIQVRSPTGADFSSSLCVQTGSGAHPASYPMGTGGSFPGGKARPGRDTDHSPLYSAEVKYE